LTEKSVRPLSLILILILLLILLLILILIFIFILLLIRILVSRTHGRGWLLPGVQPLRKNQGDA